MTTPQCFVDGSVQINKKKGEKGFGKRSVRL